MAKKPPAWSFSSITLFETCHRKYQGERITKEAPFKESKDTLYGKDLHKAAELYIKDGTPLPPEFGFMQGYMEYLAGMPGKKLCEMKLGVKQVDGRLQACDFFDKQVWFRGAADLVIIDGSTAWIVDYKSGKSTRSDPRQLALMAAAVFLKYPEVKKAKAILLYVIPNVKVMETYTRDAAFEIFSEFDPLLAQREEAYASDVWNPMPNGLCAKYCGVKSCPHNGG